MNQRVPTTQSIKYIGSKLELLSHFIGLVRKTPAKTVFDGFSGTTRVSQALAKLGFRIICNDIADWSRVLGTCYLMNKKPREYYSDLIAHLNALSGRDGWFTEHYGGEANGGCSTQSDGRKRLWLVKNTRKLDAIREEIDRLNLDNIEKAVALTSLMLALDKVDNTIGHFASYLREWAPRAFNDLHLEIPEVWENNLVHSVYQKDILELTPSITADLAYYDPPYGSNNDKMPPSRVRYAAYYHIWKSVILFDKPQLFGRAGRRKDSTDVSAASVFEEFRRDGNGRFIVVNAIETLLKATKCPWIILSYSSGGRATAMELNEVINNFGRIRDVIEIEYKRNVMSGMKWTNEWIKDIDMPNREFLFLIENK
ncbi:MAG: DNA methyltransferase [Calditrichaeota bacterium]|nr:DNA methyltransferase [Calditrichota bacterium]